MLQCLTLIQAISEVPVLNTGSKVTSFASMTTKQGMEILKALPLDLQKIVAQYYDFNYQRVLDFREYLEGCRRHWNTWPLLQLMRNNLPKEIIKVILEYYPYARKLHLKQLWWKKKFSDVLIDLKWKGEWFWERQTPKWIPYGEQRRSSILPLLHHYRWCDGLQKRRRYKFPMAENSGANNLWDTTDGYYTL